MVTSLHTFGGGERLLEQIERRLRSRDGVLDVVSDSARDYGREVFATDGFGQWPADSLHTVDLKGGSRVLVDSGRLMADITGAPQVEGESVVVGTDLPYAKFLQAGANGAPRRNPTPDPGRQRVAAVAERLLDHLVDGAV
ncbi:hypothetical protein K8Z61_18525 [Nocardioides sp. TRM66260-LWL]|uniref:hypothetical protein n=1 Tax=Nocardioides sp. TRM66260-LWL TaxID=2874478 RepID=UPI001CC7C3BC|nr:hypothetical protein [Nocardioides sp. TRM66260-LWL]MBZ5736491.1 hypothetical protein [Nocardioides sp. TRM66260-LWL]